MQTSSPRDSIEPLCSSGPASGDLPEPNPRARAVPYLFDWLVYAGIVVSSLASALLGAYRVEADTVAYLDLSDAVRLHRWHALFNGSWFPLYPAFVALGKAAFGNRPACEFMAARLVDSLLGLFFVLASIVLAGTIRRLMLARGVPREHLLSRRTLFLWVAIFAYFFVAQDLNGIKPDALTSAFLLLAIAATFEGLIEGKLLPFIVTGVFGGLAYWTKAFAFPVFLLWLLLVALVNLRGYRVLLRLGCAAGVFALIAAPYIRQISVELGHLTIGDSGTLNSAWYVNGADRINPVSGSSLYQHGNAVPDFVHPGTLLASSPEITYYGGDRVFGTTPQWDDFSYWSDGLKPRFSLHQTLAAVCGNFKGLMLILPMRLQAFLLVGALCGWGLAVRRASLVDPVLPMAALLAVASVGSLLLVHFESRYVSFAFIILGALWAGAARRARSSELRGLHAAILLMAALILTYALQQTMREWKTAVGEGAEPMHGVYSLPVFSAGAQLASLYPAGSEVACMGDTACWADPYWAKLARLKMTAIIETGNGYVNKSASEGCAKLAENPAALDALRQKDIRAIVAEFGESRPCSPQWLALGRSGHFFYLPL